MGKIVKSKDVNGNIVYPITIAEAVVVTEGTTQKTLKQELNDIKSSAGVTGVKGNSESAYRTGQVNITKANIGLGNVENTALSTWAGSANLTTTKVGTLGSGATKNAGSAEGNVPLVGTALGTTDNVPVVTDTNGKLKPHASGALGTAAFTASTAYLGSSTKYAASSSKGGSATSAEKVNSALTIGGKTFDGSAAVEITAADLGISGAMHFVGVSTTDPKTNGATVSGYTSWQKGDVVIFGNKEFILNGDSNAKANWVELGDESSYAVKATTLAGYGITDAYTKTETGTQITNAINALDGGTIGTGGAGKTITSLSQSNGQVSATFGNISITKSQVSDFPSKLPASDVTDTYSATGKVPVSGTAVASAIATAVFFDTKIDGTNEIEVTNDDAIFAAVIAAVAS